MKKGTTPIFEFQIPLDVEQIKCARVIFAYGDTMVFKKDTAQLEMSGDTIRCKLTQEDTFLLDCNRYVDIQLRVLTTDNVPYASDIFTEFVERCLDKEVLK